MVETNYPNNSKSIDAKIPVNPLLDCESEITDNETTVKIETDRSDLCEINYEAIYIPSTFDWDDSNRQILCHKDEVSSQTRKQIDNPDEKFAGNQESVCLTAEKEDDSEETISQKKKTTKTKPDSSDCEPTEDNRPKEAIITIDGVM